jgi:hypothetical protein
MLSVFSDVDPQIAHTEHSGYPQHEADKKVVNPMVSNVVLYKENLWGSSYASNLIEYTIGTP